MDFEEKKSSDVYGAEHLADIYGTEKDKVNCPFYWKIGACLTKDSDILLGDSYTTVSIEDLKNEKKQVMTVNPTTLVEEKSFIEKDTFFSIEKPEKILKIKTISGRTIKCTGDHPFLTENGWINAEDLKVGDKVCIRPTIVSLKEEVEVSKTTVLDENMFKQNVPDNMKASLISKYVKDLTHAELLPLSSDSDKLPVLARLCGFIITDGSIHFSEDYPCASFVLGTEADCCLINNDLKSLGVKELHYAQRFTTRKIGERNVEETTWRMVIHGAFPALLLALGISYGKRTQKPRSPIPNWIKNGSQLVKREWLAGLQGGDGSKVILSTNSSTSKEKDRIKLSRTCLHQERKYSESLEVFMKQNLELFKQFGVEGQVKVHHQDENWTEVRIEFSNTHKNLINFLSKIGYRYASSKESESYLLYEYLLYVEEEKETMKALENLILNFHSVGYKPKKISEALISHNFSLTNLQVSNKLVEIKSRLGGPTLPRESYKPLEFLELTKSKSPNKLWVPIKEISEQVESEIVYDFTTMSSNHSFVANGFCTHNCRHGTKCTRNHNKPTISQTIVIPHMYQSPLTLPLIDTNGNPIKFDETFLNNHAEDFYIDTWEEFVKYGGLEELVVCDNICEHLQGNVYVKYTTEEGAKNALTHLAGRFYGGRTLVPEFSPVTDFREARCKEFEQTVCKRGGMCNFMHCKKVPYYLPFETSSRHKRRFSPERKRNRSRSPQRRRHSRSPTRERNYGRRSPYRRNRSRSPRRDEQRPRYGDREQRGNYKNEQPKNDYKSRYSNDQRDSTGGYSKYGPSGGDKSPRNEYNSKDYQEPKEQRQKFYSSDYKSKYGSDDSRKYGGSSNEYKSKYSSEHDPRASGGYSSKYGSDDSRNSGGYTSKYGSPNSSSGASEDKLEKYKKYY